MPFHGRQRIKMIDRSWGVDEIYKLKVMKVVLSLYFAIKKCSSDWTAGICTLSASSVSFTCSIQSMDSFHLRSVLNDLL